MPALLAALASRKPHKDEGSSQILRLMQQATLQSMSLRRASAGACESFCSDGCVLVDTSFCGGCGSAAHCP